MENAQLIAVSTQSALKTQLNVVANNIANMNTNGYKSQTVRFAEYLMPVAEASTFDGNRDQTLSYVLDAESVYNFKPGATVQTDSPLDVAVNGPGWFTIETDKGVRYTRDGNFSLNTQGELITSSGNRVLGDGAPIVFTPQDTEIEIAQNGTITTSQGERGKLTGVVFENLSQLKPDGVNLYSGPDARPSEEVVFLQGLLEQSNTEPVNEMTKLIDVTRTYESVSRMLKKLDDLRETAIGRLGRVEA